MFELKNFLNSCFPYGSPCVSIPVAFLYISSQPEGNYTCLVQIWQSESLCSSTRGDVTEAEDTNHIWSHDVVIWHMRSHMTSLCDDTAGNWLRNQLETGLGCFTYFTPRTVADRLKIDKPENWLMNRGR